MSAKPVHPVLDAVREALRRVARCPCLHRSALLGPPIDCGECYVCAARSALLALDAAIGKGEVWFLNERGESWMTLGKAHFVQTQRVLVLPLED